VRDSCDHLDGKYPNVWAGLKIRTICRSPKILGKVGNVGNLIRALAAVHRGSPISVQQTEGDKKSARVRKRVLGPSSTNYGGTRKNQKPDLESSGPAPPEELLAPEIGVTKLATDFTEAEAAQPVRGSLAATNFRLKQAESAQKHHLAAIKTLTLVRALPGKGSSG
jgi:hypothetical protein